MQDVLRGADFEQSSLFKKIYQQEFGMPGGEPYGLLIGDYLLNLQPSDGCGYRRNLLALEVIAEIAMASFVPFVTSVGAELFAINDYREMSRQFDLEAVLGHVDYTRWRQFCAKEVARFIGLILPTMLYPTEDSACHAPQLRWGSAIYALAAVVGRSFIKTRWFLDAFGLPRADEADLGGIVPDLLAPKEALDDPHAERLLLTVVNLTPSQEHSCQQLGLMTVISLPDGRALLSHGPMLKAAHFSPIGEVDQDISSQLPYLLCVCRFAQYIKIIGRNKIGQIHSAKAFEHTLQNWLLTYIASNNDLSPEMKVKFPLQDGRVSIQPKPGSSHHYRCALRLSPHLRTTHVTASVVLTTELTTTY